MGLWPLGKAKEKEPTLEGEGTETKEGEPVEKKKVESSSDPPPTDTGVQSPFSHPGLVGKSEQELADLLALQALTIKEQSAAVAGIDSQPAQVVVEPEPEPVKVTSEEFFLDPAKVIDDVVTRRIQKELKEVVAPLEAQFAKGFAKDAWTEAAEQLPNLTVMRPMIEAVLKRSGIANPSVVQIVGSYDLAVGQSARQGTPIPGMETRVDPAVVPGQDNSRVIPQHSPSTQPLAQVVKTPTIEPLNEFEARLAREKGLSPEDYRALQDLDAADVLAEVEEGS